MKMLTGSISDRYPPGMFRVPQRGTRTPGSEPLIYGNEIALYDIVEDIEVRELKNGSVEILPRKIV